MESKNEIMLPCFRPNERQVKFPNQQSAYRFPREENMDLLFDSDMVNSVKYQWVRDTKGLILLEGSYTVI